MSLYMETTKIEATRTAEEVSRLLGRMGASRVITDYSGEDVTAVSFVIPIPGKGCIPYTMPVRYEAVFEIFQKRRPTRTRDKYEERDRDQAKRTAWRIALRWLEAMAAFVDTEMVSMGEVFMPYIAVSETCTFYQALEQSGFKGVPLLEAPK